MPEGPVGAPRLTNIGPLSRATKDEIKRYWGACPTSGKEKEICKELKKASLAILENQGFFADYNNLVDINSGRCVSVAQRVHDNVEGTTMMKVGYKYHVWIMYDGKHYDAEVPTGVYNYTNLPFFARMSEKNIMKQSRMEAQQLGEEPPENIDSLVSEVSESDR
jgi:hypothetical protein